MSFRSIALGLALVAATTPFATAQSPQPEESMAHLQVATQQIEVAEQALAQAKQELAQMRRSFKQWQDAQQRAVADANRQHEREVAQLRRELERLPHDVELVAYCRGPYCVLADDAVRLLRRPCRSERPL